ncbi:MAG TPA: DUF1801 domain-containing protein [Longimicrobium sp.]|jgi:hypothetical protein|nr:DUF1801 domain-containing protein [Longimicrobium sp.]
MARSGAATVEEYLAELPENRRAAIAEVREVVLRNLPAGYVETMNWGMISYEVPLERYPTTYNGQPLSYAALASQKNYCAVYLMGVYGDGGQARWFKEEFRKVGKKLDMGKSCVRFRTADDLQLDAIGKVIASTTPEQYIAIYEKSRNR